MRTAAHRPVDPAQRKRDLAAIHLLAQQVGLDTSDKDASSDYRQMLQAQGGVTSAALLDERGRARVLAHLRKAAGQASKPRDGWHADLIRKLWGQLAELGALKDPTEQGLNAFVMSQTGVSSPRFLPTTSSNRIVETLKSWISREAAKKTRPQKS